MGRKKGKQCGQFQSKSQNVAHRHTLFVDHASEADGYRNPVTSIRGRGYRSAASNNIVSAQSGYWNINGNGGDKWSSIFSSSRSVGASSATLSSASHTPASVSESAPSLNTDNNVTPGLSRLRFLLEERRSEDRIHDRQTRLRLQRSRIRESHHAGGDTHDDGGRNGRPGTASQIKGAPHITPRCTDEIERHEPGWLISRSLTDDFSNSKHGSSSTENSGSRTEVPTLQILAAKMLAPHLHGYVETCGHIFVGECLKSVSASVLSELSISLASNDSTSGTSDGVVKAFVHSGSATGLVLKGVSSSPLDVIEKSVEEVSKERETKYLTDEGLLSLCPRLLPVDDRMSGDCSHEEDDNCGYGSSDDWESLDVDSDLTTRMVGCFHLKRLELIDIPLIKYPASEKTATSSSGISLGALRTVFRSCPGITHLSLRGCFTNWEELEFSSPASHVGESEDVSMLMSGIPADKHTISAMVNSFQSLKHDSSCSHDNGIPQFLLEHIFLEQRSHNKSQTCDVLGLGALLPELKVLDVSHCCWVTPMMIFQFLL